VVTIEPHQHLACKCNTQSHMTVRPVVTLVPASCMLELQRAPAP
jgi:hypothetical protein